MSKVKVGVADVAPTMAMRALKERGMPFQLFAAVPGSEQGLEEAGIPVSGGFDDLLDGVDIMLDSAPGGIGAKNKEKYVAAGVKVVFQGGEETVGLSGDDVVFAINIPQEPVTIPETIDAVRASLEMQATGAEAVALTDKYLGIK